MIRGRSGGRRRWPAIWTGLAVSVAAHVLLALFMLTGGPDLRFAPPPETEESPDLRWVDALRVVQIPEEALPGESLPAEAPSEPAAAPEAGLPSPEPAPAGEAPAADAPGEALTNAERLRPRVGDPRLWARAPVDSLAPGLADRYDRAETAVRRLLRTYLDSLELSEEQERRAREWVFGEGDEKWGISPEGLHLGDVTIPIPFGQMLSQSGEARRQAERVLRTWEMIQFQAGRLEAQEIREERLEAIRERTRERLRGAADGAGADSSSRDTTGG